MNIVGTTRLKFGSLTENLDEALRSITELNRFDSWLSRNVSERLQGNV